MLKTILAVLVAAIIALGSGVSAFAATTAFADLELVRVYYDRAGEERATALGKVADLTASGGTFDGNFGALTKGYAVYFSVDRTNNMIWATGATGTASVINGALSSMSQMKTGAGNVLSQFNFNGTGNSYTGLVSAVNSYKNKLSATQGTLNNAITADSRLNTEADLGPLLPGGGASELKQILYHWSKGITSVAEEKVGIPVAYITTKANGSTVISPPPPSAPTGVSATAGDAEATVSFTAPVSAGGSAVTGYIVTSEPDGKTATGLASPITVTGLTNGTAYKFTVAAINEYGTGPFNPNGKSASVTPVAAAATYTVNASVSGGHGTIAPAGNTSVAQGGSLTLTISPDPNYHLSALTDNGVIVSVVDGTYTITDVAADHTVIATYALDTYSVTASVAGGNGTLTPASSTVGHGDSVTLTVTPAANHHLATLTDNGSDVISSVVDGTYTITGVSANHEVIATYAIDTHSITASVTGGNGTLTPDSGTVSHGGNVTLTVAPTANHHLATLTDNGVDVTASVSGGSYAITGVATDHAMVATFAIDTWTVTAAVTGNGTLTPASGTVNHGDNVTLTIEPAANHHLSALTDNGNSVDITNLVNGGSYTITGVTAIHSVVATFAINGHTVTPSVGVGTGHGSIAADTPQTVGHGSTITFTLTPEPIYLASVTGTCGGTLTGNSYTTLPIVEDCTVIANFSKNNYTVIASAGANGSVTPAVQIVAEGALATVTITPVLGYKIASVTGTCNGTQTGDKFITDAVTANCTVEASFNVKTSTVTASVSGGNGSVSPASSTVDYGGSAVVTITPAPGYHLASLTKNGTNETASVTGASYTLTNVTADHTIVVTFAIDTKSITTAVASGNGTITPSSNANAGSSATLTIVPAVGYHLAKVTDNGDEVTSTVSAGSYTLNAVSTDHVVMAYFEIDTKSVSTTVSGNGTIVPGISSVNYGSNLTLAVAPAPNHRLVTLIDNGFDVTASVSGGSYTITGVTTDHAVTATFALQTKEVTATVAGGNGSITPASSTVSYGGNATLSITPAPNYHLATLTDNGADVTVSVIGGVYTLTGISESHNVIATFAIGTRSVTAVVSGSGTVTPASSVIDYGGSAILAVTPANGYSLERLTDNGADVTGSVNNGSYTISNVRENHAVVASFRGITFSVTPSAGANGVIGPAAVQSVDAGKSTTFTVRPNAGYQIASVTGCGGTLSGDIYTTAVINGNCSVSATFITVPALRGDLDGNKKIEMVDALMALQFAVGLRPKTAADVAAGDVAPIVGGKSAPDGKLDVADAFVLLRRSVDDTFTW